MNSTKHITNFISVWIVSILTAVLPVVSFEIAAVSDRNKSKILELIIYSFITPAIFFGVKIFCWRDHSIFIGL